MYVLYIRAGIEMLYVELLMVSLPVGIGTGVYGLTGHNRKQR